LTAELEVLSRLYHKSIDDNVIPDTKKASATYARLVAYPEVIPC